MPTSYTSLLGFALPVTGELNGTWGDVVNDSITQLAEDAISGTATASVTSGDWTLTTTGSGATNQARCAILIPTGTPGVSRNIIAPSSSKAYIVDNQSDSIVVLKGSATTGVSIAASSKALCAWNGTDFVQVGGGGGGGVPVGSIIYYPQNTLTGYINANGTPVLASSYPSLVGVLEYYLDSQQRTLPVSATWNSIAWNGTVFCAVAQSSNIAATSPDGITWTQRTLPVSATWRSIAWNGTVFCAVASGSNIAATSPDGITWTQRTLPTSTGWFSIAWNGTIFCAVASGSTIAATSPDGITWTQRTLPVSADWRSIAWNGTVFCAVAQNSTNAATSPDGITWTQRTLPVSAFWNSIAWNGTIFCAVASGLNFATSPDGITWTQRTLPVSSTWSSIAWNGTVFCAVAQGSNFVSSPDGITWTQRTLPVSSTWSSIAWNGTVFCAVASGSNNVTINGTLSTTLLEVPNLAVNGTYPLLKAQ